ncbi:MAG: tetratricopeptide repeat protein, partial [Rhodospirillales bacterium]|nr:tetratricopeptide repeat protein [Rhodospirillales bacterium]
FGPAYPGGLFRLRAGMTGGEAERNAQLAAIAQGLGLEVEGGGPTQVEERLAAWLRKMERPYLWIVDDLPAQADAALLAAWQAPSGNGHTLVTTPGQGLTGRGTAVAPGRLGVTQAYALLTAARPPADGAEARTARRIVKALGGHALAVAVAAEMVPDMGFGRLLAALGVPDAAVLAFAETLTGEVPSGAESGVAAILLMAVGRLDMATVDLLRLASLLADAPIPQDLIGEVFAALAEDGEDAGHRRAQWTIARAVAQGLAQDRHGEMVRVHPLVLRAMRRLETGPERREVLRRAAQVALEAVLGDGEMPAVTAHLWVAHAHALAGAESEAENALALLLAIGRHHYGRRDYTAAAAVSRQALEAGNRILGEDHPAVCAAQEQLGLALHGLGQTAAARRLHERVLA